MSTNYYLTTAPLSVIIPELLAVCDVIEDKHGAEVANVIRSAGSRTLHIGLSSVGWTFALHVFDDAAQGPASLSEWVRLWSEPGAMIFNEYGDGIEAHVMLAVVTERVSLGGPSIPLRRHTGGATIEAAIGEPTYDLVRGEFS